MKCENGKSSNFSRTHSDQFSILQLSLPSLCVKPHSFIQEFVRRPFKKLSLLRGAPAQRWQKNSRSGLRGHPFMTSTGRGVRLRWTHVDGGVQPHVDVHTEN